MKLRIEAHLEVRDADPDFLVGRREYGSPTAFVRNSVVWPGGGMTAEKRPEARAQHQRPSHAETRDSRSSMSSPLGHIRLLPVSVLLCASPFSRMLFRIFFGRRHGPCSRFPLADQTIGFPVCTWPIREVYGMAKSSVTASNEQDAPPWPSQVGVITARRTRRAPCF